MNKPISRERRVAASPRHVEQPDAHLADRPSVLESEHDAATRDEPTISSAGGGRDSSETAAEQRPGHKPTFKERIGTRYLALFSARSRLGAPFRKVPEGLHRVANQAALSLELIDDFKSGDYRSIPWGSLALLTGALLYTVSPADLLPDAVLGLGQLDDAMVLALAMRWARPQLQAYCHFKGYPLADYFGPIPAKQKDPRATPRIEPEELDLAIAAQ